MVRYDHLWLLMVSLWLLIVATSYKQCCQRPAKVPVTLVTNMVVTVVVLCNVTSVTVVVGL